MTLTAASDYDLGKAIPRIVAQYDAKPTALIMVLQDIQTHYRYLPQAALELVAHKMELPLAQVYGVATFYRAFSLKPKGRHHICVCTGTACHVRQAGIILDRLQRDLGVSVGKTTSDGEIIFETVNCLGACALGPLVTVDETFHGDMTVVKLKKVLRDLERPVPDKDTTAAGKTMAAQGGGS